MNKYPRYILWLLSAALLFACTERQPTEIRQNRRPETHLFLYPGSVGLDTTLSTQILHWWGDDPDGRVMGYYYRWNFDQELHWTRSEYDTFLVPIRQKYDAFSFYVQAVDNSAQWIYPVLMTSAIDDECFQDVGSQKEIYDAADIIAHQGEREGIQSPLGSKLFSLSENDIFILPPTDTIGAVDNSPASLIFPIRNSKPKVQFVYESNPPDSIYAETFTTRSFFWTANDSDGIETITSFYYYLADANEMPPQSFDAWTAKLPGEQKSVTLRNIEQGFHVFYLAVEDIAGELGPVIRYPAPKGQWYVRQPFGEVLLVDDYEPQYDIGTWSTDYYHGIFDTLSGVAGAYSVWDIEELVPYSVTDIYETLNFFDRVIWYGDADPHFQTTAGSIFRYIMQGKKMLISSVSPTRVIDGVDSLYMFLKNDSLQLIDEVLAVDIGRAGKSSIMISQLPDQYPDLKLAYYVSYIDALLPSMVADSLYVLDKAPRGSTIVPCMGIKYPKGSTAQFIYLNFPLHYTFDFENINTPENRNAVEIIRKFIFDGSL